MFGGEDAHHMKLTDSRGSSDCATVSIEQREQSSHSQRITRIPAFLQPYWNHGAFQDAVSTLTTQQRSRIPTSLQDDAVVKAVADGTVYGIPLESVLPVDVALQVHESQSLSENRYSNNIFSEVERFTTDVVERFQNESFDIIHAHDWMTFPAAVALAEATAKPLITHVHSLEQDRSGMFYDASIDAIEEFGLRSATRVVAVSHYTKRMIETRHCVAPGKIAVVHNGIYPPQVIQEYKSRKTWPKHVVLFLGRITYQKGPEYFVEAAAKAFPHIEDTLFVMAGAGDMLEAVQERVKQLEMEDMFLFPGFVQGEELEELLSVADLYIMPSVSEPFGLSALEAVSFDIPVILSKQSGVAEVISHALKTDFWDTDRMSELMVHALTYPELRLEMASAAKQELSQLHWEVSAIKTTEVYQDVLDSLRMP
jgi:glycosyltransferase involved in cell wall biosynthesis